MCVSSPCDNQSFNFQFPQHSNNQPYPPGDVTYRTTNNAPFYNHRVGSSFIEYEPDSQGQIIQTQSGQQGPISLPSLAGSLKNYQQTNVKQQAQQQKQHRESSPVVQKPHSVSRSESINKDKEKEADKARKKGELKLMCC